MAKLAYIRVSTIPQHTDRQEAIIAKHDPDKVFLEKASGKTTDRPQLQALLSYMREGDTVYIESYSRLGRSTHDLLGLFQRFAEKGVTLVSDKENLDTSTPQGKLMMTIFASLSEFERELTHQRVMEGLAAARLRGRTGGRPRAKIPDNYAQIIQAQITGDLSPEDSAKAMGVSRSKYYEVKAEHLKA